MGKNVRHALKLNNFADIDQFGFKSMASAIPGGLPRQTKDDAMPQAYTCSWTKAVHSLKYSSFVMLLEAPQIWRMKRYNVLETELVYRGSYRVNFCINLQLINPHRAFVTFFFWVLRNFWRYFRKNQAYHSEVTQQLKIWEFSGFVYKTYGKWLFVLKSILGSKSVLFALILVNITVIWIDYQYLNNPR